MRGTRGLSTTSDGRATESLSLAWLDALTRDAKSPLDRPPVIEPARPSGFLG